MFGYVNINRKGLTEQDLSAYRAYYCGLCQRLKDFGGRRAQLLLNYDITFLVVLLSGLYEPEEAENAFTCRLHPAKKRLARTNVFTDYGACMDVLLSYHSLLDDWRDEGSRAKKAYADALVPLYEDIRKRYPRQAAAVERFMKETTAAEERAETNIDVIGGLTGDMLAELFVYETDVWENDLRNTGYYLGKFIYLLDAYCDMDRDRKKKGYNPLLLQKMKSATACEAYTSQTLTSYITQCARSFERMPILKNAEIIRSCLYSGVWTRYEIARKRYAQEAGKKKA